MPCETCDSCPTFNPKGDLTAQFNDQQTRVRRQLGYFKMGTCDSVLFKLLYQMNCTDGSLIQTVEELKKTAGIPADYDAVKQRVTNVESKVSTYGTAATKDFGISAGSVPVIGTNGKLDPTIVPDMETITLTKVMDYNNMITDGQYMGNGLAHNNTPSPYDTYSILKVISGGGGVVSQTLYGNRVWHRYRAGATPTWTPWVRLDGLDGLVVNWTHITPESGWSDNTGTKSYYRVFEDRVEIKSQGIHPTAPVTAGGGFKEAFTLTGHTTLSSSNDFVMTLFDGNNKNPIQARCRLTNGVVALISPVNIAASSTDNRYIVGSAVIYL